MPDPTVEFNLITFEDVRTVSYSPLRISRSLLRDRILFARTNQGNFAKFQVHAGDDLRITRLTVYNPQGCIVRTAANLTIRSSYSCDLDNAAETSVGADFWWHAVSPGVHFLEPQNAAVFHRYQSYEEIAFAEVSAAPYQARRVERPALRDQVLFCRTSQGRFAKLLVQAGDALMVRRMTVYRPDGAVHLDRSNVSVPQTWTLDLDTGNVGAAGFDLWWAAESASAFFLTPMNGASISFQSYFAFEKYLPLLRSLPIRNAMVFVDGGGTRAYDAWPEGDKLMLREFLYLLETGRELPIAGPPALTSDRFMSLCSAKKIYLAHVAQSLWVDASSRVNWHLAGASAVYLEHLFDMRRLLQFTAGQGHSFEFGVMGGVTHWSPSISFDFLVESELVKANPWETIKAVTDWARAHLIHITGFMFDNDGGPFATQADQWQHIYGYRGLPLVDKMLFPLPGRKHTTHGCWGTDGFLAALLRTVNIPVRHGRSNFSGFHHSRAEFFSVGQNLAHGDDPYNAWVRLGHNNVPVHRIFMDNAAIAAQIDGVAPATASFNHSRRSPVLGVEFKTNHLLRLRCQDVSGGLTGHDMNVWQQLHEFFTDAEIDAIVVDCDAAIAAIPGGCAAI